MLRLDTLGALSLTDQTGERLAVGTKPLLLLAILATRPRCQAAATYLQKLLWPESRTKDPAASLRQALLTLRRLGTGVARDHGEVSLDPDRMTVDLWEFDAAVSDSDHERAIELYGGRFLQSVEAQLNREPKLNREILDLAETTNARISVGVSAALDRLIRDRLDSGRPDEAVNLAQRWVELNPMSEKATIALFRSNVAAGHDVQARQAYSQYKTLIARALGDSPSPKLERLMQALEERTSTHEAVDLPEPFRRVERRARVPVGAAALTLVFLGASSAGVWWLQANGRGAPTELRVSAVFKEAGADWRGYIRLNTDGASNELIAPWSGSSATSPDGQLFAYQIDQTHGLDIAVDGLDDETRIIASTTADEKPIAWTPDGRTLLYQRGWLDLADSIYRIELALWDRFSEVTRIIQGPAPSVGAGRAALSPEGTRIAVSRDLESNRTELLITNLEGEVLERYTMPGAFSGHLAWSPDRSRIAFSSGLPSADIFVLSLHDGGIQAVAQGPSHDLMPIWLSFEHVGYQAITASHRYFVVSDLRPEGDTYHFQNTSLNELESAPAKPRMNADSVAALLAQAAERIVSGLDNTYISQLDLELTSETMGVGERTQAYAITSDSTGLPVPFATAVDWAVTDSSVASVSDHGLVRAVAPGRMELIATLAGGRQTRRQIEVREFGTTAITPSFSDEWSMGIRTAAWISYGDPAPSVRQNETDPDRHYLVSNGDQNFLSGVVTTRRFSTTKGVTVEFTGSGTLEDRHFQGIGMALTDAPLPEPGASFWKANLVAGVWFEGHGSHTQIVHLGAGVGLPSPEFSDEPRRYALQLAPNGDAILLVDGRVHGRGARGEESLPDSVHVSLFGVMVGTELRHEDVVVYEGERYVPRPESSSH